MLFLPLVFFLFFGPVAPFLTFSFSTQTFFSFYLFKLCEILCSFRFPALCHNTSVPKPEALNSVGVNWEGQACVCFLHLPDITTNHKTSPLYIQP